MRTSFPALLVHVSAALLLTTGAELRAAACVWKVTDSKGGIVYLGGSYHALRKADYPLPGAFDRAFDASTRIAFEIDHKAEGFGTSFVKAGLYPKGDQLKNHVNPRTYQYLCRVLAQTKLPQELIATYRPWFLAFMLDDPTTDAFSSQLGVESYLARRARQKKKSTTGLESTMEHVRVFSGLNDHESEACLLLGFIELEGSDAEVSRTMAAWRRGDVEAVWRSVQERYQDFPMMAERLLTVRNRNWVPKIEGYMHSGKTYFVVAGAAHFGGPNGVLSLLRQRGCQVEQL